MRIVRSPQGPVIKAPKVQVPGIIDKFGQDAEGLTATQVSQGLGRKLRSSVILERGLKLGNDGTSGSKGRAVKIFTCSGIGRTEDAGSQLWSRSASRSCPTGSAEGPAAIRTGSKKPRPAMDSQAAPQSTL